eukprot:SAG11_NODE_6282_length_1344_cov_2.002410_1_plen_53_part_00
MSLRTALQVGRIRRASAEFDEKGNVVKGVLGQVGLPKTAAPQYHPSNVVTNP